MKKVVAKRQKVYKWYVVLSIIYSLIGIVLGLMSFKPELVNGVMIPVGILAIFWFLLNIAMLTIFIVNKVDKMGIWLSGLYLFDFLFSFVVGFVAGVIGTYNGLNIEQIISNPIVILLGMLFPAITLYIAIKLFNKK